MKSIIKFILSCILLFFFHQLFSQSFNSFDLNPGSGASNPYRLTVANGKLLMAARETTFGDFHLFVTDGTVSGTSKISDVIPMDRQFYVYNNELYFSGNESVSGTELWRSNGTALGTGMVKEIAAGNVSGLPFTDFTLNNGLLCFFGYDGIDKGLWRSDGTESGTVMIKYVQTYPYLISNSNKIYFNGYDTAYDDELWISDGTSGGTYMLKDINPNNNSSNVRYFCAFNGKVYFSASDGIHQEQLWVTDGTVNGTQMVLDLTPGNPGTMGAQPDLLTVYNGHLYFRATDRTNGFQVWKSDGTVLGTQMLKTINSPAGCDPSNFFVCNDKLFFVADSGSQGKELWFSDGSTAGTSIVKDIAPGPNTGSNPRLLTTYHNKLYFVANDGNTGDQLWVSDGTETGTYVLQPSISGIAQNLTNCVGMVVYNNKLYFNAHYNNIGEELWCFDDTPSGTENISIQNKSLTTYPNPVSDIINIDINTCSQNKFLIEIFDIFGQSLLTFESNLKNITLDLSFFSSGLYVLKVSGNDYSGMCRFIKTK